MKTNIDLSTCDRGDILISTHGAVLKYIGPTPIKHFNYLDHVVKYYKRSDGSYYPPKCYGTRTNDGFVFKKNRLPEEDHDIQKIIKRGSNEYSKYE